VLIVDGFDADGLPAQLCSQAFYDDCYTALADNGILVVNIWKGYPRYDEYLSRLNNSFDGNKVIMDVGDDLNHIVLAVKNGAFPPSAASIRYHANLLTQSHALNFQAKANRLIRALPKDKA
jgi:spermidine synthase